MTGQRGKPISQWFGLLPKDPLWLVHFLWKLQFFHPQILEYKILIRFKHQKWLCIRIHSYNLHSSRILWRVYFSKNQLQRRHFVCKVHSIQYWSWSHIEVPCSPSSFRNHLLHICRLSSCNLFGVWQDRHYCWYIVNLPWESLLTMLQHLDHKLG